MIPKIIHYCWFGGKPLPELAVKCIESWRQNLPDYEIVEWSEKNFDITSAPRYVKEAHFARKYAFVSDYVRLYALHKFGGIYFDTDVEVLKPLDSFLHHTAFLGFEDNNCVSTGIIASVKGGTWVKDQKDYYHDKERSFYFDSYHTDETPNVTVITRYMLNKGMLEENTFQDFPSLVTIYPSDFFCPKSWATGEINITNNTHTIHHFAGSWVGTKPRLTIKGYIRSYISEYIDKFSLRKIWTRIRYGRTKEEY